MRTLSLVLVLAILTIMCNKSGTLARSLQDFQSDSTEWRHATELTVAKRTDLTDMLPENHNPCFSLRENEPQRELLCNDRRTKFNRNPFGLRFGKRLLRPAGLELSSRAGGLARSRTIAFLPVFLTSRELEVPT
ncbi:hypothetical protein NHX12_020296 [Muraenolepis orangiensis]|uniref:Kisspeptin 2 n=1 Tax=Muraenolepis orangiensis TaxID=630683 RepID=A0A9Q0EUT4_9TELE|nr:hypothetical protein NHX12_020296 [Muraenolepis orangiensis]